MAQYMLSGVGRASCSGPGTCKLGITVGKSAAKGLATAIVAKLYPNQKKGLSPRSMDLKLLFLQIII